jgi:hypothetical protein
MNAFHAENVAKGCALHSSTLASNNSASCRASSMCSFEKVGGCDSVAVCTSVTLSHSIGEFARNMKSIEKHPPTWQPRGAISTPESALCNEPYKYTTDEPTHLRGEGRCETRCDPACRILPFLCTLATTHVKRYLRCTNRCM